MRSVTITRGSEKKEYSVPNEAEMIALGRALATSLHGGEVIALHGNLGAGKTTFTKGIAEGLHIDSKQVTSPTFVLMKVYPVKEIEIIQQLCHVDTYRLSSLDDLISVGIQEYLGDSRTVTIIEWPEPVERLLSSDTIHVTISLG
ncbi:MAG: tRNA (adenosine(37)-N6)-threonylcarbamoyltransferase complex ATPase subunit type 1 TsaE [bacterium]|nr:tRNA (adenosine(37)-N6)-threonylcarbamoyltransferase complex ATPase subunit type 1 TsaE [bacterium]